MSYERPWFWTEVGRERWQLGQIEDLQASVSGAYHQASRLRSQLSRVEGSLQSKVDRLAAAFDAFVELSDVRLEMAVFNDAAIVRRQADLLLTSIGAGGTLVPPDLPDVSGYWLVPALRALHARLDGDRDSALKHTEAATELDPVRSRYFLTAAARLAGPVDATAVELAALLPDPHHPDLVHHASRAFWQATAAGAFGDAGRALLGSGLSTVVGRPSGADAFALTPWLVSVTGSARGTSAPQEVANTLAALRRRCQPAEKPPADAADAPHDARAPHDAGAPSADNGEANDPTLEPLAAVVRSLIGEGHEPERELLRRAEKLRGLVETGTAPAAYEAWDEPVGAIGDLVRADVFGADVPPGPHQLAVRVAAPWLLAVADSLAERGRVTAPSTGSVRIRGHVVAITAAGADAGDLARLRKSVADGYSSSRTALRVGTVVAAVGLVVAVLGFAALQSVGIGLLGIIAAVIGGAVALNARHGVSQRRESAAMERADIDRSVRREVDAYQRRMRGEADHRERIDAEHAQLSELLG